MFLAILLIIINFLIAPKLVYAISPPVQTSPIDNSQVPSSKLTWEIPSYPLYSNDPYRIQVDDNSDFASVYRDYKTKNTYYKPVLTEGTWYWRIKAKDSSGTWSDWSNSWSFILTTETPPSTATPSATPSPSPPPSTSTNTPSPKPKTTTTPSKTPAPTIKPTTPTPTPETTPKSETSKTRVNYQIASVAAVTASPSSSAKVEVKSQKKTNYFVWIGIILIFAGIFSVGYIYLRKNASISIRLRRRN